MISEIEFILGLAERGFKIAPAGRLDLATTDATMIRQWHAAGTQTVVLGLRLKRRAAPRRRRAPLGAR
jgi:hypothetical protein